MIVVMRVEKAVRSTLTGRPVESRVVSETTVGRRTEHLVSPSPAADAVTAAVSDFILTLTSHIVRTYLEQVSKQVSRSVSLCACLCRPMSVCLCMSVCLLVSQPVCKQAS